MSHSDQTFDEICLKQKFAIVLSQVTEHAMAIFTVYSLCPTTSEVYKMNTFSLNSDLEKNIYVVSTPKLHFPAVPAQDRFYFLNERELQMNQEN